MALGATVGTLTRRALAAGVFGAVGGAIAPAYAEELSHRFGEYDTATPDYTLPAPVDSRSFNLTAETLRTAAHAFRLPQPRSYDPPSTTQRRSDYAVFAIRGASSPGLTLAQPETGWDTCFTIQPIRPNYEHLRCVFGLWSTSDSKLKLFLGSTVPNYLAVDTQLNVPNLPPDKLASALPTGHYVYPVTCHHCTKKNDPFYLPAVLHAPSSYRSLRPRGDMPFGEEAYWVEGSAHNIHPARGKTLYSSQGCLVIHGNDTPGSNGRNRTTAWKTFVDTLRLDTNKTACRFYLFTGDELSRIHHCPMDFAGLRFGSYGDEVRALQRHGRLPSADGTYDGDFGIGVQGYVLRTPARRKRLLRGIETQQNFHATIWADELYDMRILPRPAAEASCPVPPPGELCPR
jgi:hypothetical protein